jgi:hypothetical protein
MYGPLLVAILLTPFFLVPLFFAIFPYKIYKYYDEETKYVDPKEGNRTHFYNMNYEVKHLEETGQKELLIKLQKNYKRKKFWDKIDDNSSTFAVIAGIIGFILVVFFLLSIINPLCVRAELTAWEEFAVIAEETLASTTNDVQEAGVVNKILEYNEWIAKARASQRSYGNWSSYWNTELPGPILLK